MRCPLVGNGVIVKFPATAPDAEAPGAWRSVQPDEHCHLVGCREGSEQITRTAELAVAVLALGPGLQFFAVVADEGHASKGPRPAGTLGALSLDHAGSGSVVDVRCRLEQRRVAGERLDESAEERQVLAAQVVLELGGEVGVVGKDAVDSHGGLQSAQVARCRNRAGSYVATPPHFGDPTGPTLTLRVPRLFVFRTGVRGELGEPPPGACRCKFLTPFSYGPYGRC